MGVASTVRVTLQDGSYREDVGYGLCENLKSKGDALEKARKSSVTDALKRALKHFGNSLGNCLHSKDYLSKIKRFGAPAAAPLDLNKLHRHPDFMARTYNQAPPTSNEIGAAPIARPPPPQNQVQPASSNMPAVKIPPEASMPLRPVIDVSADSYMDGHDGTIKLFDAAN